MMMVHGKGPQPHYAAASRDEYKSDYIAARGIVRASVMDSASKVIGLADPLSEKPVTLLMYFISTFVRRTSFFRA